jgi:dipeptidyl aminopeptidase/acylaminoacyl peptidase
MMEPKAPPGPPPEPPAVGVTSGGVAPVKADPTVLTAEQLARGKALEPKATSVVGAYANQNGIFSGFVGDVTRDGKRVLFGSLRDGSPQIYLGDLGHPGDPPKAITVGPERGEWASFTADEKYILYTRDEGADENYRIYRVLPDGSALANLTPGDKAHRSDIQLPRDKPDLMVYSLHKSTEASTAVVVQGISAGEPKVVYSDPAPGETTDVTADGSRVLFVRFVSANEIILFEIDVKSGKTARVFPAEGKKAAIQAARYAADGKRIYVATDDGGEAAYLLSLEPKTFAVKERYKEENPGTALVGDVAVSPKGDKLALVIDAGNHSELRVLDAKTLTPKVKPEAPLGLMALGKFTADGTGFTVAESLPDKPFDIYRVDATSGAVKPLRDDKRPGIDSLLPMATSIEKVQAFDGLTLPVNLYLPKSDAPKKMPTLVIFHGGPASSYSVRFNIWARFFGSLGYAIAEPNIRGSTGFGRAYEMADNREKRGDVLKDAESVNRWVKSQPWCDPDRVVIMGGSYGGYMTLMGVTRQPTLWRAGIDLFGVADLKAFLKTTDQAIRSAFVDEFGDLEKDAALLDQFSPMRDKDKIVAPLFVYAGQNDPRVPRSESDAIVVALRTRKIPVEYMVAANEGHSLDRKETKIEFLTRAARFLEEQLK